MDKEEAMKILKDFHDKSALFSVRTALDTIIPELKVSEDEEVRKIILDQMKCWNEDAIQKNCEIDIEASSKCIAWLEKQGEHANFLNKIQIGDKVTRNEFGVLVNLSQLKRVAKPVDKQDDRLEKQKEDKINTEALLTADKLASAEMTGRLKERKDILENPNKYGLQKQGEHKPVDKVESKFHEGEWIVWQNKCYKVNDKGCGYELIDQNGLSTSLEYGTVDTSARLWDITKDAKDGDVLSYVTDEENLWIMIYRSLYEPYEGHVHYHALLVNDNFTDKGTCCISTDNLNPATKEQRDLLFQKMTEAGYKWDAEKKELKKIEQKPAWSEDDEMIALSIEQIMNCASLLNIVPEKIDKIRAWLKSIKDRIQLQPKPEWSEEDEKRLKSCLNILQPKTLLGNVETINTKWLKSLKERIGG